MKLAAPQPFDGNYPKIPDGLAIVYVAVTMFIMAYSFLFKIFPILIFLGIWFAHLYYKRTFILRPSADLMLVLFFPLLCCYSAFWSDAPAVSFYAGAGLISMVASTVIIARTVSGDAFIKGVTLGTMLTLTATLLNGNYARDYFNSTAALVGLFRSKNEVGFFAEVGLYTSLLLLLSKATIKEKFIFAVAPLLVCGASLFMCKSASSVISLAIALAVTCGVYLLRKIPAPFRALAVSMGILSLITLGMVVATTNIDLFAPVLKVFGKDSTLTGRTYLWSEGIKNGMKEPVLGHGYYAFWQPGNPDAERYWRMFDIPGKTGFHFHNLFIQTFVDFGFVGLSFVVFFLLFNCYKSIRLCLSKGIGPETGFALGISFMLLVRAFVEVDLFGPFGIGPLLYFSIIPRLTQYQNNLKSPKRI